MKQRFGARGQELPYGDGGQGCALQLPGEKGQGRQQCKAGDGSLHLPGPRAEQCSRASVTLDCWDTLRVLGDNALQEPGTETSGIASFPVMVSETHRSSFKLLCRTWVLPCGTDRIVIITNGTPHRQMSAARRDFDCFQRTGRKNLLDPFPSDGSCKEQLCQKPSRVC